MAKANDSRHCKIVGCFSPYCCKGYCHNHSRQYVHPDKARDRAVEITCIDCGDAVRKVFGGKTGDRTRCVSCARRHGAVVRMATCARRPSKPGTCEVHYANCDYCGKVFVKRYCRKYCTTECLKRASADRYSKTGCCRQCGGPTSKGKYYCEPCRKERDTLSRREEKHRNRAKRGANHRQRARKFGVPYEPVNPMKVYARDGWVCQICGASVSPISAWPDPQSKSLDHIIPLSRGGAHSYKNVQLAHLRCNVIKSDRVDYPGGV